MPNQREATPLRVAQVVLQLNMGGMEKLLVDFARHTDRRHQNLQFVSLETGGCLATDIKACGWPVTELGKRPGLRPGLVFRLAGLFRRWRTEVVHTHNNAALIYAAPAARLAGVRAVIHTRHGRGLHASGREVRLFRLGTRLVDRVVCVSDDSARMSAEQGLGGRQLCRIWNGIDLSRFAHSGPRADGPAVMVGRLVPVKDVDTLVRATALVVRQHPSFQLCVAGEGECLPALRQRTTQLGLDGHVRFLGLVRDIPALLAGACLFVLPSLSEGISLTLLEAMAVGLPAIATRVGGNSEVIEDGKSGLLVPPANPAELAGAILRLLLDPAEAAAMGRAGRRRVEEHFDVIGMLSQYERLYREVLGRTSIPGFPACTSPCAVLCNR